MHPSTFTRANPARTAAIDGPSCAVTTFDDLDRESTQLARLWAERGLVSGDSVAVLMTNSPRYLTVVWAALRSGLYVVPVNWHLTAYEAEYIVSNSGARALVVSGDLAEQGALLAGSDLAELEINLVIGASIVGFEEYQDALRAQGAEQLGVERSGSIMPYSSGTTGLPKGIKPALPKASFGTPGPLERLLRAVAEIGEDTVYLCPAPLYHAAPLGWSLAVQSSGGSVVVMDRFDAETVLALIELHGVTHAQFVPTMFSRMLKLPKETRQRYDLSSLRYVAHAGAPCPVAVKELMIEWLGPIVHEYYGGSEGICFFTIDTPTWLSHRGSVGKPLHGTPHIVDEFSGAELPPGDIGQIWIDGPTKFEYHGDKDKTREAFNDRGWSTMGDLGWLDDEGYLYLSDRRVDLIIVGGSNVYPREVEDVLGAHPDVNDVAVIGIPDDDMGHTVRAVIQTAPGVEPSVELEAELLALCACHLASFKRPRSIEFRSEIPRLPTGKLLRRAIRDSYA